MSAGRVTEVVWISALATLLTVALAAPVLRAPSERVFGQEIVGRHHDPFTVMEQLEHPIRVGLYSQPVTDIPGALLARVSGGVAAYNWLVLISFPISAAAAYLLGRHLALSRAGAGLAALAYAFAPFHVAHAAYHPHIAQTQWIPLYLLALWRCLDAATPGAVAVLGAATVAVTLSNFYGGFIAAVITPAALAAYWLVMSRGRPGSKRALGITAASLGLVAVGGLAYATYAAGPVVDDPLAFAVSRTDLLRYSARWWSYLVPPVAHPLLGAAAQRTWTAAGVREGLLEQQVSLGAGVVALGLVAIVWWWFRERHQALGRVPVLAMVAVTAFLCSLAPERTFGAVTIVGPSSLLYAVAPMFRSYARFGVVVQLMAALLAGIGLDALRRAGTRGAQVAGLVLVAVIAGEYAVAPSAQWRDVLPTTAHRWIMGQPRDARVLDCVPLTPESALIPWLTGNRARLLDWAISDCGEPNLPEKLAAKGYTHLLVRQDSVDGRWFAQHPAPQGLRTAADLDDGQVFVVTALNPAVYTSTMTGFYPRERNIEWSWRWMGGNAAWTIANTRTQSIAATLDVELSAFHRARTLVVLLDGHPVKTIRVEQSRRTYEVGPLTMSPGDHEIRFQPAEPPTVAATVIDNRDRRPLSMALGTWRWTVESQR